MKKGLSILLMIALIVSIIINIGMFYYLVKSQHSTMPAQEIAVESTVHSDLPTFPSQLIGEWAETLYTLYILEDGTVYWKAGPDLYKGSVSGNALVFTKEASTSLLNDNTTIYDIPETEYKAYSGTYTYVLYGNDGLSITNTAGKEHYTFSFVRVND